MVYFAQKPNSLQSFLFAFYLLLICWTLTAAPFFKRTGLPKWTLIALFLLKMIAGFAYAKYYALPQNIATADTWNFYKASLKETDWLLHDPIGFVKDYFHSPYAQSSNLFAGSSSYWNDLDYNTIVKGIAVANVLTGSHYYTDLLLFNFLFFLGPVALYRLTKQYWKYNKFILLIPIFLLPSFLFWCSGLHKDGLIFTCIAVSLFCLHKQLVRNTFLPKQMGIILICFLLLFALRNVVLLLLLPALLAYSLAYKKPQFAPYIFGGIYLSGILLFFSIPHIFPSLDFPKYIISKQEEFNALSGNSKVSLPSLQPSFFSFANFLPYAVDLVFFRPHVGELKNANYTIAFFENTFILILAVASLLFQKINKRIPPLLLFFLFFSLSMLLLCGYTVTYVGAIVRYKSLVLPFLSLFFLLSINNKLLYFMKLIK